MAVPMTVGDLIKLALKAAGVLAVGQTPLFEDANDALVLLNGMLSLWNQNRWLVFHLVDVAALSTGAMSYSVGTGGAFNVTRPDRIESGYARLRQVPNNAGALDFPLYKIDTYEEYASISLKSLPAFPGAYFYDPTMPMGTVYFYPVPNANFQMHIVVKDVLQRFNALTDVILLPPEYYEAIFWNFVGRLQLTYQLPVSAGVAALAKAALNTVSIANHRVPDLRLPPGLGRSSGGSSGRNIGVITEGIASNTFTLNQSVLG